MRSKPKKLPLIDSYVRNLEPTLGHLFRTELRPDFDLPLQLLKLVLRAVPTRRASPQREGT
jgi:hypothetical protein